MTHHSSIHTRPYGRSQIFSPRQLFRPVSAGISLPPKLWAGPPARHRAQGRFLPPVKWRTQPAAPAERMSKHSRARPVLANSSVCPPGDPGPHSRR